MNCCNANGMCTQGDDCPVRQVRPYCMNSDLPGPLTIAERVALAVVYLASAAFMVSFLSWLYFKHGESVARVLYGMANRLG
jgi:hypothetical protein